MRRVVWPILLAPAGLWSAHVARQALGRPERLSSPGYLLLVFLAADFLAMCLIALILVVFVWPVLVGLIVGMLGLGRMLRGFTPPRHSPSPPTPPADTEIPHRKEVEHGRCSDVSGQ